MTKGSTMPLSQLNTGARGRVMALRGGRHFQQRIVSLGLSMGCEVEVLQKGGGDNSGSSIGQAGCGNLSAS